MHNHCTMSTNSNGKIIQISCTALHPPFSRHAPLQMIEVFFLENWIIRPKIMNGENGLDQKGVVLGNFEKL